MIQAASILIAFFVTTPVRVEVKLNDYALSNQKIEAFGFHEETRLFEKQATSNAAGVGTFNLDPKGEYNIIFRSLYQEVPYFSTILFSKQLPKSPVTIKVFKSANFDPRVTVKNLGLYISAQKDVLLIDEEILIENNSPFTITGTKLEQGRETFRISLPGSTHDLRFTSGFEEKETRFDGNDVVTARPLLPGDTRFSLKFAIERSTRSAEFDEKFSLPVENLNLASAIKGAEFSGVDLHYLAEKYFNETQAATFSSDLRKRNELKLFIGNLPLKYRFSQVLPFVGLLILVFVLFSLLKRKLPLVTDKDKNSLLKKLVLLKRLRAGEIIDEWEFQSRRLKVLEELLPLYSEKTAHPSQNLT